MTETYYHNGPSRAWRSELLREGPCAKFYGSGGRIQLYAPPIQELPPDLEVMAYIFTLRNAVLPVVYSVARGSLFFTYLTTEDGEVITTESGEPIEVINGPMSIDPVTGVISGITPSGGTTEAVFQVVDATGRSARTEIITFVISEDALVAIGTESGQPIGTEGGQPIGVSI